MLHALGDINHHTRQQFDGFFAPFLIPSLARHTDQDLVHAVMDVPVVAAPRFEGYIRERKHRLLALGQVGRMDGSQITVGTEVLGIAGVRSPLREAAAQRVSLMVEPCGQFIDQRLRIAHVHRAPFVGRELRSHTVQTAQGSHRHYLAVGSRQLVARKDIAEQMRLQIIVILGTEGVVEGTARQPGLHLGALLQCLGCIVPHGGTLPRLAVLPAGLTVLKHLVQHTQRIERTRETRVGIELGKSLLQFIDGHAAVQRTAHCRLQAFQVALCHQTGTGCQSLLTLGQRLSIHIHHTQYQH